MQREISKLGFSRILPYTSRSPRRYEKNGAVYHFISEKNFFQLYQQGIFIEKASYKMDGGDVWHYGIAFEDFKEDAVMIGNPRNLNGLSKYQSIYPFVVYLDTDENVIYDKLIRYYGNIGEAQRRMVQAREDFSNIGEFIDYRMENDGRKEPGDLATEIRDAYEAYVAACLGVL